MNGTLLVMLLGDRRVERNFLFLVGTTKIEREKKREKEREKERMREGDHYDTVR